jgi:hypothetical protein
VYDVTTRNDELKYLEEILLKESENRYKNGAEVYDVLSQHNTFEWVLLERKAMLEATNILRSKYNLPLVEITDIYKLECCAIGHIDYSHKYALYCLELGRGENKK